MVDHDPRPLVDYGAMVFNSMGPDNALRRKAGAMISEIVPWIMSACARSRLRPDGMGAIIYEAADAGDITQEEAGLLIRSFLSAGVDTTVTGIGNALWCLASIRRNMNGSRPTLRWHAPASRKFCGIHLRCTHSVGPPLSIPKSQV